MAGYIIAAKIGGIAAGALLVGTGAGLGLWWFEEAVQNETRARPWLIPVVGGIAATGIAAYVMSNKMGGMGGGGIGGLLGINT
jgi:hypothetical protein